MFSIEDFEKNCPLKDYCTFGIGGPARYFISLHSIEEAKNLLHFCKEQKIPYFVLGKGSNCLFDDQGFPGLVIQNKIHFFESKKQGEFHVGAGYNFSLLGTKTAKLGWGGLEFASGIPGSVGGAVFMNAGANGSETCQHLLSVDYLSEDGELHILSRDSLHFSYRRSPFQDKKGIILGATFSLEYSPSSRNKQLTLLEKRRESQPLKEMSAGCVFRNPSCGYAGALIEQCGLKGFRMGDAEVSMQHSNFVINKKSATSKDVLSLIQLIKTKVKDKFSIELETEIRYISPDRFL